MVTAVEHLTMYPLLSPSWPRAGASSDSQLYRLLLPPIWMTVKAVGHGTTLTSLNVTKLAPAWCQLSYSPTNGSREVDVIYTSTPILWYLDVVHMRLM